MPDGISQTVLSEEESRHAAQVLRLQPGSPIILMDGEGGEYPAEIESASKKQVRCRLTGAVKRSLPPVKEIILVQAVLKKEAMDWVVEKSAELGVRRLVPLITRRTTIRAGGAERWGKIAASAAKQSERSWLMAVEPSIEVDAFLARPEPKESLRLLCLERSPCTVKGCLHSRGNAVNRAMIVIGPEGGFAPEESSNMISKGFEPVGLGDSVLRSETAALTMINFLQYEWL